MKQGSGTTELSPNLDILAGSDADSAVTACNAFREPLLRATLNNALRTPFYQVALASVNPASIGFENWSELPLTNKEDVRTAGPAAQIREGLICNEIFSGGTTGAPLVTLKGDREQQYIRQFYEVVFEDRYEGEVFRALQINNPYHGHLVAIPVPLHSHKIGIYDAGSFDHGLGILRNKHQDRGVNPACTVLVGLERCLRAFTDYAMRATAQNQAASDLQMIVSYSQLLTDRWRTIHENFWGCPVVDRFGLSEVFGGATQDLECGWWYFDPVLLPEVVSIDTREPITEGIGELVLTGLYPFQEAQPLIRYLTGDLVEVTHTRGSRPGMLAIRPLGRWRYGVPGHAPDSVLLNPREILETIDACADVQRSPRFVDSSQVVDPYRIGHPLYATTWTCFREHIAVKIAVVATPSANRAQLGDLIYERLVQQSEPLREAIEDHSASLVITIEEHLSPDLISHAD